ncbi:TIGR02217 family protein [Fretibacter rubidus]|uniref:phage distal tail protein, Rcc01695 family n=1 Tax=Fretibacter rubidus TaxID=570162 RepID=UPI003529F279
MSAFHDVIFPLRLAFGASGGPVRKTDITQLANGYEHRNSTQSQSRRRFNAAAGIKSHADIATLMAFFEARHGQLYSFRFKDPLDHAVNNAPIATGDGQETEFQLIKIYGDEGGQFVRKITKPRAGSVTLFNNSQPIASEDVLINYNTGLVTFNTPPAAVSTITASFDFDVIVRFDTEGLDLSLEAFGAGEVASIPLIEVLTDA